MCWAAIQRNPIGPTPEHPIEATSFPIPGAKMYFLRSHSPSTNRTTTATATETQCVMDMHNHNQITTWMTVHRRVQFAYKEPQAEHMTVSGQML